MTLRVSVVGASGRMGKLALEVIQQAPDIELHSALDSKSDLAEVLGADVIFEATRIEFSQKVTAYAIEHRVNLVVATSGWSESLLVDLRHPTESAVVIVPNFSIGSTLATNFASAAAKYFSSVEIIETHHAKKVDSPSGTAIRSAELISKNLQSAEVNLEGSGVGQPSRGQLVAGIPVHSLRLDGASARQEIVLSGNGEVLRVVHEVNDLKAYSLGILQSIRFANQNPGVTFGLDRVLGL